MPTSVAPYRVTARNPSVHSANTIHDDPVARRYGFRGGLVPGGTVCAYMTRAILGALDLLLAADLRPVARLRRLAIYRLRAAGAGGAIEARSEAHGRLSE